ncbi:hypothetical protein N9C91_02845 [Luminiphilus sp.]|nr:hypothetical protein [Luminiphilus sp.]
MHTMIFFGGVGILSGYRSASLEYQAHKHTAYMSFSEMHAEVSLNLVPAMWLSLKDGRGDASVIEPEFRDDIGGFFPLGSAPSITTFYCREDEGFISYKTDRYGLRNNDEIWDYQGHDIAIFGDSFAESACVSVPLQDYFDERIRVVSIGKGGNGPLTSLASLTEYLDVFSPRIIFHLVVPNDYSAPVESEILIDFERERVEEDLLVYLRRKGPVSRYFSSLDLSLLREFAIMYSNARFDAYGASAIRLGSVFLDAAVRRVADVFSYPLIRSAILRFVSSAGLGKQEFRFVPEESLVEVYDAMALTASSKGADIVFALVPSKFSDCNFDARYLYLERAFAASDYRTINLWQSMCDEKFFSEQGAHFNSVGYRKLSEILGDVYAKVNRSI